MDSNKRSQLERRQRGQIDIGPLFREFQDRQNDYLDKPTPSKLALLKMAQKRLAKYGIKNKIQLTKGED